MNKHLEAATLSAAHLGDIVSDLQPLAARIRIRRPTAKKIIKRNGTPKTWVDELASRAIRLYMRQKTPDIPVLCEEREKSFELLGTMDNLWVLDPLDGTRQFLERNPNLRENTYSISLGLLIRHRPQCGMVFFPEPFGKDAPIGFFAFEGSGGIFEFDQSGTINFKEKYRGPNLIWKTITISLSSEANVLEYNRKWMDLLLENHPPKGDGRKPTVFGAMEVVCGLSDVFISMARAKIWDILAVYLLLRESGGVVAYLDGRLPEWSNIDTDASTVPLIFARSLAAYVWVRKILNQPELSLSQLAWIRTGR